MSNFSKIIKANKYTMSSVISGDSILFDKTVSGAAFDMESVSVIANRLWTPLELGNNLVVWYDGTVTVDGSNNVVTVVDKSGNNNHGTVFGTGTLTTGTWNGLGSIIRASGDAGIEIPIGREDAYAWYMTVDRMESTNGVLVNFGGPSQYFAAFDSSTNTVINQSVAGAITRLNGDAPAITRQLFQSEITNGGVVGCDFTSVTSGSFTSWKITQYPASTYWFGGQWGDFIMLKSHPTTKNRQRIEGYLAHRRGIQDKLPIDHPYRENPPLIDNSTEYPMAEYFDFYWSGRSIDLANSAPIPDWTDVNNGKLLSQLSGRPTYSLPDNGVKCNGVTQYLWSDDPDLMVFNNADVTIEPAVMLGVFEGGINGRYHMGFGNSTNATPLANMHSVRATVFRNDAGTSTTVNAGNTTAKRAWMLGIYNNPSDPSQVLMSVWMDGSLFGTSVLGSRPYTFDRFAVGCLLRSTPSLYSDNKFFAVGLARGSKAQALIDDPSAMFAAVEAEWNV